MANEANLFELVRQSDGDGLGQALRDGADPNACDALGVPVLVAAAGQGDVAAVTLLLEHGAALDRTSPEGNSALMLAAARGQTDMVTFLLARGADPVAKNKWGFGPRDWGSWSEKSGEILSLLETGRR